jgi:hypothetical protein
MLLLFALDMEYRGSRSLAAHQAEAEEADSSTGSHCTVGFEEHSKVKMSSLASRTHVLSRQSMSCTISHHRRYGLTSRRYLIIRRRTRSGIRILRRWGTVALRWRSIAAHYAYTS